MALGGFAQRNLDEALAVLRTEGHNPDDVCFAIDVDASSRFRSVMKARSPCFLRSRARGFYLSSVGRRMSVDEMAALQGFPCFGSTGVSSAALGGMLGNAMSMNIVVRVMAAVLPFVGISAPSTFVDPWLASSKVDAVPARSRLGMLIWSCLFTDVLALYLAVVTRLLLSREHLRWDCFLLLPHDAETSSLCHCRHVRTSRIGIR